MLGQAVLEWQRQVALHVRGGTGTAGSAVTSTISHGHVTAGVTVCGVPNTSFVAPRKQQ